MPWAGFIDLPKEVDAAAVLSLTIRYQRDLIRRHAKDHLMKLIHEEVFLEIEPDRGTRHVRDALRKVEKFCLDHQATLLLVDFSQVQCWRSHTPLQDWSRKARDRDPADLPGSVTIDGKEFDPHSHFSDWRHRQQAWVASKSGRADACLAEARGLREGGLSYAAVAARMNAMGLSNLTGKPWTGDNLRKFMAKQTTADPRALAFGAQ